MGGAVEAHIARLLTAANRSPTHESHPALAAIANGVRISLSPDSTMSAWMWVTLRNLEALHRAGAATLRRCRTCGEWFPAGHASRRTCYQPRCQKKQDAKRQAEARRREQTKQRRARVTAKRIARTR